jgi:antirestriction protein ArdC
MNKVEKGLKTLASLTAKARSSEEVLAYLDFMSQFHNYSFYNTVSIFFHCPTATHVAGYVAWQKLGRYVRKGEVGIPILAPCFKKKDDATDDDETDRTIAFYKVVYVFDVSQTDGEPLPEAPITAKGSDQGLLSVLEQITAKHGIHLEYKPFTGSHHGTSYGGSIEIDDRLEPAGKVSVLLHELAHEFLHHQREDRTLSSSQQRELEAEATAYVVCSHFNVDTAAFNYLALWNVLEDEIMASFQRIHTLAMQLINEITTLSSATGNTSDPAKEVTQNK